MWWLIAMASARSPVPCPLPTGKALPVEVRRAVRRPGSAGARRGALSWWRAEPKAPVGVRLQAALALAGRDAELSGVEELLGAWGEESADHAVCRAAWADSLLAPTQAMDWHARAWRALGDDPAARHQEKALVAWARGQDAPEVRFAEADRLLGQHPLTVELAGPVVTPGALRPLWRVLLHEAETGSARSPTVTEALGAVDTAAWLDSATPVVDEVPDDAFWALWGQVRQLQAAPDPLLAAVRSDWRRSGVQGRAAARATALLAAVAWRGQCGPAPRLTSTALQAQWQRAVREHLRTVEEALASVGADMPPEGRIAALSAELDMIGECVAVQPDGWSEVPALAVDGRLRALIDALAPLPSPEPEPLRQALLESLSGSWRGASPSTARAAGRWVAEHGHGAELFGLTTPPGWSPASEAAFLAPLLPSLVALEPEARLAAARRWLVGIRDPSSRSVRLAMLDVLPLGEPEQLERGLVAADAQRADAGDVISGAFDTLDARQVETGLDLASFDSLGSPERVVKTLAQHFPADWSQGEALLRWAEDGLWDLPRSRRASAQHALADAMVASAARLARAGDLGAALERLDEHLFELGQGFPASRRRAYGQLVDARAAAVGRAEALAELEGELQPGSPEWCAVAEELRRHDPGVAARERWDERGAECAFDGGDQETGAVDWEERVEDDVAAFERSLARLALTDLGELQRAMALAAAADGGRVLGQGRPVVADHLLAWAEPRLEGDHLVRARRLRSVAEGRQGHWAQAAQRLPEPVGALRVPLALQRGLIELRQGRTEAAGQAFLALLTDDPDAAAVNLGIAADELATRDVDTATGWLDRGIAALPDGSAARLLLQMHRHRLHPEGAVPAATGVDGTPRVLNALARLYGAVGAPEVGTALVDRALATDLGARSRALLTHSRAELAFAAGDVAAAEAGAEAAWAAARAVGDGETGAWAAALRADLAASRGNAPAAVLFGKLALQALARSPYGVDCARCDAPDVAPVLVERVVRDLEHQLLTLGRLEEAQILRTHAEGSELGLGWPELPLTDLERVSVALLLDGHGDVVSELAGLEFRPEVAPVGLPDGVARLVVHVDASGGSVQLWHPAGTETLALGPDDVQNLLTLTGQARDPSSDPRPAAQQAYDRLLRPYEDELRGVHTLQIAASGSAAAVPWSALHDGERWLADRLVVWAWSPLSLAGGESAEALGAPVVGFAASAGGPGVSPLPGAEAEVTEVADQVFLNQAFNRRSLMSALWARPRVVHLATHFVLDPPEGEAFVALGDGRRLTVADLSTLRFHGVELVVLSACNTARAEAAGRLGSVSDMIQRQGARHVVGTLWPVADDTTAAAMQALYDGLDDGLDVGRALQRAQRALWSGHPAGDQPARGLESIGGTTRVAGLEGSRHPYFWAPFVVR